jgi:SAM-dependent methyltransferase
MTNIVDVFYQRELVDRRDDYKVSIHLGDFFILRHLKKFIYTQILAIAQPDMQVGDVGCGEQPFRSLIQSCGAKYTGIDAIQNSKGTVDIVADISSIPLPSASFDAIVCTEVLEHISDPIAALRELSRLLKPKGKVIFSTPFAYPIHEAPYDFCRLTPFFLEYWLPKLGFAPPKEIEIGGNELEVIATVWGHIWMPDKHAKLWQRVIFALLRAAMNIVIIVALILFRPFLKQKYFLSMTCILEKQ